MNTSHDIDIAGTFTTYRTSKHLSMQKSVDLQDISLLFLQAL